MSTASCVRITNGLMVLAGALFFKPLACLVGAMMIVAGLTGFCAMEKLFQLVGARRASCAGTEASDETTTGSSSACTPSSRSCACQCGEEE